jgi:hypothetical protein
MLNLQCSSKKNQEKKYQLNPRRDNISTIHPPTSLLKHRLLQEQGAVVSGPSTVDNPPHFTFLLSTNTSFFLYLKS